MNKQFYQVRHFHEAFNHPVARTPTFMPAARAEARAKWKREEIQEFLDATTVEDQADAMIDLIYFALGTLVEIGVPPEEMFNIVQEANMAKLWPDGKPRHREDGKIIKPEGWEAPEPKLKAYIDTLKRAERSE